MFNNETKFFRENKEVYIGMGHYAMNFAEGTVEETASTNARFAIEADLMKADLDDVQRQIDEHNESEEFIW